MQRLDGTGGTSSGSPDLPGWALKAQFMKAYNWTERQFDEEVSPAMLIRLIFIANTEEAVRKAGTNPLDTAKPPTGRR